MIIGALEELLSPEHLEKALNRFIHHFKYNAYSSQDFEDEMISYYKRMGHDGAHMRNFITSWTHLPGLPLLRAIPVYGKTGRIQKVLLIQVDSIISFLLECF